MDKIVIGEPRSCEYRKTCYGIVRQDDKFLLSYNHIIEEYSLPGGGVENGESLEQCIEREFLEEVGYKVTSARDFVNIDCYWLKRDGRYMQTDANFLIVEVDKNDIKQPLEEQHKAVWVSQDEIMQMILFPYQLKALEIFLSESDKFDN